MIFILEVSQVAVSDKKKKSNAAWDAKNMQNLACKVRIDTAEAFKAYAAERGTSVHALLKGYVRRCLAEDAAAKRLE